MNSKDIIEEKIKQVIVIRKDLNMRKGKMIAQGCHASISFLNKIITENLSIPDIYTEWLKKGQAKICVGVDSLEELLDIYNKAKKDKLEVHLTKDSGLTEFKGNPTITCLAIGPDKSDKIDEITKHLKLL